LLGALLVTAIAQAAERRATIPEENRRDFTLYVERSLARMFSAEGDRKRQKLKPKWTEVTSRGRRPPTDRVPYRGVAEAWPRRASGMGRAG